jgi:uncharacterized membrane protein
VRIAVLRLATRNIHDPLGELVCVSRALRVCRAVILSHDAIIATVVTFKVLRTLMPNKTNDLDVSAQVTSSVKADLRAGSGPQSWTYIYVALGFFIAIGGTIIQMIEPLEFPWNIVAFIAIAAIAFWIFLFNALFQNRLMAWKNKYEERPR